MSKFLEAAPGFYLLEFYIDDADGFPGVDKTPVIGWWMDSEADHEYITPSALVPGGVIANYDYLLMPNGDVCDRHGSSFTFNNWLNMAKEESTNKGATT
jgi:hypothetical protein